MATSLNPLWAFFHKSDIMFNKSHWTTHCEGCVRHHQNRLKKGRLDNVGVATAFINEKEERAAACELAGAIRGEKGVFITHILGSRTTSACPHASKAAQTEAKAQREGAQAAKAAAPSTKRARPEKFKQTMLRTYTGNDMPFSAAEADAIEAQALRAIISSNSPFRLFEEPEMLTLFGMMRSQGPQILPSAKVIGGRLLNEGSESVEAKLATVLKGKNIGVLQHRLDGLAYSPGFFFPSFL
ncbi:hypothetical protein B0H14DRAFT_2602012 [Mycena olivaceomarginata]|nr:hypothetical protein B0H14DRAFT_2602012 [Mycena olivaceomarginata]